MQKDKRQAALDYHEQPMPGKLAISITKPTENVSDLSLAYTPGVAEPVREIAKDPAAAYRYTAKGNLVAVITDGTAVLGLGDVGALAGKPVMEGKAVLFKKFADIDVFDIEVNAESPQTFIETVVRISPTFGGINLEDIKAPQCFDIEEALIERLDIPVFHDDQHGTAVVIAAGLLNALHLSNKKIEDVKIVCLGAGAAGIASMRLLVSMGARRSNIYMVDRQGVVHSQRRDLNAYKFMFANNTDKRTLEDALTDADVFIGVSGPDLVTADQIKKMAPNPLVFALSNPDPEIHPDAAKAAREDIIMATGRSDFPNQVNNVLGFPYIFRGALDVRARRINQEMLIAAVETIAQIAREPVQEDTYKAYPHLKEISFGPDYIIPKPMDNRLRERVPAAVAAAAVRTGVAQLPYPAHYPKQK